MRQKKEISVFWFRRDLRLEDNVGLAHALSAGLPVLPLFIFDEEILNGLPENDARVTFIHSCLMDIDVRLKKKGSSLLALKGNVLEVWKEIILNYAVQNVFFNTDYEPYAIGRDKAVVAMLKSNGIKTHVFKDQVIFEENDVLKADGTPYTVYTPYKNKWLELLEATDLSAINLKKEEAWSFHTLELLFPSLESIGFVKSRQKVYPYNLEVITDYHTYRDYPAKNHTSYLSPHLRFGTVSIRKLVLLARTGNPYFLSELIWREFFMQILFHFPHVVTNNFKSRYDGIAWRNDPADLEKWCEGKTGYPLVDAGMRELNETGYMHNRIRMVSAGFLCKHLLIDWKLGETYFAERLLDYELSSNNGNWQWAAGTGCDAAPYFRIFNPMLQLRKFDRNLEYVKKWIPELDVNYPEPMVEHGFARERCLQVYKKGIGFG